MVKRAIIDSDGIFTNEERQRILEHLHSLLFWVGVPIPKVTTLEGEKVRLRNLVHAFISNPRLTPDEKKDMETLIRVLEEKGKSLEAVLAHGEISEDEAIDLLNETSGILRAIDELREAEEREEVEIKKAAVIKKVEDQRRWMDFIDSLKGRKEGQGRG